MTRPIVSLIVLLLVAAAARADETLAVEPDQVLITVDADAGGKQISAVSHALDWNIIVLGEERAHVHLSVPVTAFVSGHSRLDEMVREAAGWMRHPAVDVEGEAVHGRFTGTISIAGLSRPLAIPIDVGRAGEQIVAHARFRIDLRDYGITVPPLDGGAVVEFVARLHASPRAVFSGGSWHGS